MPDNNDIFLYCIFIMQRNFMPYQLRTCVNIDLVSRSISDTKIASIDSKNVNLFGLLGICKIYFGLIESNDKVEILFDMLIIYLVRLCGSIYLKTTKAFQCLRSFKVRYSDRRRYVISLIFVLTQIAVFTCSWLLLVDYVKAVTKQSHNLSMWHAYALQHMKKNIN